MRFLPNKFVVAAVVLALVGVGAFIVLRPEVPEAPREMPVVVSPDPVREVIGYSVEGRTIEAYTFSSPAAAVAAAENIPTENTSHLLFVGGIHGGYEWNSVLLAYRLIDHLTENPDVLPDNLTTTIIPALNPDGLYAVVGTESRFSATDTSKDPVVLASGRFNANAVDLNRNFDCKWQPESTWRGNIVSAGTSAFSEPEARAMRDFVLRERPSAVVFWHSKADAVYASECENGILPETREIMNVYADASGYMAVDSFDAYPITGDAEGWLASIGIPAITVELRTRDLIEWDKNLPAIEMLFSLYSEVK